MFPRSLTGMRLRLLAVVLLTAMIGRVAGGASNTDFRDRAPAMQALVRQVIDQLEHTYAGDPDEHRQRYRRLGQAIQAWNASPRSDVDVELMSGWLRAALEVSVSEPQRAFPPLPQFTESRTAAADSTPKSRDSVPVENAQPSAATMTQQLVPERRAPPADPAPRRSSPPSDRPASTAADDRELAPIYRDYEAARRGSRNLVRKERLPEPSTARDTSITRQPTASSSPAGTKPHRANQASTAVPGEIPPAGPLRSERPGRSLGATPPNRPPAPQAVDPAPPTADLASSTASRQDNPFRDDPLPAHTKAADHDSGRRHIARRTPQANRTQQTWVNMPELRARMVGYERGLRAVEARLMSPQPLSATVLTELTRELDELLDQREFLELYWGTLSPAERRGLPELRSAAPVVAVLSERVVEERHALRRRSHDESDTGRRDLLLLQEASRKLTNLGSRPQPN